MTVDYSDWPLLPELFPISFPGIQTGRDSLVVDIDYARLVQRMTAYFDPAISHTKIKRLVPTALEDNPRFDSKATREKLLERTLLHRAQLLRLIVPGAAPRIHGPQRFQGCVCGHQAVAASRPS